MDAFFQWLASNSIAAAILLIGFGAIVIIFIVAFFQEREISFWPPKIGPRPKDKAKENNLQNREASDGLNTFQLIKSQWARDIKVDRDRIAKAKTIDWMGVSLRTTVYILKEEIETCLSMAGGQKGAIRMLLVDPVSDVPKRIARYTRDSTPEKLEGDIENSLNEELPKFFKRNENARLEAGFFNGQPPYRLIIVNRNDTDSGYIRLRVAAANTTNMPTVVFTKKEDPDMFNFFVEQFEIYWQSRKEAKIPTTTKE